MAQLSSNSATLGKPNAKAASVVETQRQRIMRQRVTLLWVSEKQGQRKASHVFYLATALARC